MRIRIMCFTQDFKLMSDITGHKKIHDHAQYVCCVENRLKAPFESTLPWFRSGLFQITSKKNQF